MTFDTYYLVSEDFAKNHPNLVEEIKSVDSFLAKILSVEFTLGQASDFIHLSSVSLRRVLKLYEENGIITQANLPFCPLHSERLEEVNDNDLFCSKCDRNYNSEEYKIISCYIRTLHPDRQVEWREMFDVFLCHNNEDKPEIRKIAKAIRSKGLNPWFDEEQLRPGYPWQRGIQAQIPNINSAAVFVGKNGFGPWQNQELDAFLQQFNDRGCPVIPVLLPDCEEVPDLPPFLQNFGWVDFRKSDPDPLERLYWGITGKKPNPK